jgi:membrane protein YqaA with SNARE-associated domain
MRANSSGNSTRAQRPSGQLFPAISLRRNFAALNLQCQCAEFSGHQSQAPCENTFELESMTMLHPMFAALAAPTVKSVSRWIYHLGAIGFIPLGVIDSSLIPIPGSMDVLIIVLSARQQQLWLYFAIMATVGSVLGAFITFRLARKGGAKAMESRFSADRIAQVNNLFKRWGFGALAIPAILPPPMPMVPFVFAAGAMQYSTGKFIAAMSLGRIIRYSAMALLAAHYGRPMRSFIARHGHPATLVILGVVALGVGIYVFFISGQRKPKQPA